MIVESVQIIPHIVQYMTIVTVHGATTAPRTQNFFVFAKFIDGLWYAVHRSDLNGGIGFRQLGWRFNGLSRAKQIGRELTFSIASAMLKRYRLALLALISALYMAVFSSLVPVGHSREDFVVKLDSQRTLPKVTVTGRRGGGFSFGYLSLNMGRGGSSGFNPFYNLHNQSDLEAKCEGAGHDNPACLLLCEIFPASKLCSRSFGTITVTGQRETPYNEFTRYEIRNGVVIFTSEQKDDEDEKQKKKEGVRKFV